jgi:hypothetical protein
MPTTYEINPNNVGTIAIALTGVTPVSYACQITNIVLEPTANTTTTPGTYCAAPHDTPGASSWALVVSFLQDWGNASRTVTDGVTTSGDATLTSATAAFVAGDVGKPISGTGIPAGTTILSRTSGTSVELSANATATGTGISIVIGQPSLSEFTFDNDGMLCDFIFTTANPATVPSMSGTVYVTATSFGGEPGASWQVTTQRWACPAKPTLT